MTRKFTITHNGHEYGAVVATIASTHLGSEDHGCLTFYLHCEWPGGGVGVGGYALDQYDKDKRERVSTAYGLDAIKQVLATLGAHRWEDLPGQHVLVLFSGKSALGSQSVGIAHPTDEKRVLILKDHANAWLGEDDQ